MVDTLKMQEILAEECNRAGAIMNIDGQFPSYAAKAAIAAMQRAYELGVHDEAMSNAQDAAGADL